MKKLTKNEWVAVGVTLSFALVFFSIGSMLLGVNPASVVGDANIREADVPSVEINSALPSSGPVLVAGKNPGDLFIYDFAKGSGTPLKAGDTAVVHYVGFLEDGRVFDSSRGRDLPYSVRVGSGDVIEGWDKGLLGMQVGGKRRLVIPPDLAYGEEGFGPIPANSTIVFDIELLSIE